MTPEVEVEVPSTSREVASPTVAVVQSLVPVSNSFTELTRPSSLLVNAQRSLDQNSSFSFLYITIELNCFLNPFMMVLCMPYTSC